MVAFCAKLANRKKGSRLLVVRQRKANREMNKRRHRGGWNPEHIPQTPMPTESQASGP